MFEISQLKAKKLPELQEIAKKLNVPKYRTQKKLDLVYQILDYQAANPEAVKATVATETPSEPSQQKSKPPQKRARVPQKPKENKEQKSLEFSDSGDKKAEATATPQEQRKPHPRKPQERKPQENKTQENK